MNGLQQIVSGDQHYFETNVIEYCPNTNRVKYFSFAITAVDFFNEISLIWGIVCELGIPRCPTGDGFPQGFEYRWADGDKVTVPIRCSGPQYVDYVLTWVEEKLNDGVTFPSSTGTFFSCVHLNISLSNEKNIPLIISRSFPEKLHDLTPDDLFKAFSYFCDCVHQSPTGTGGARSSLPSEHVI